MSIITVSRGAKSGGIALAEKLSERLGYQCLSREILVASANRYNIDEGILQRELEKPPSLWQRLTHEHHQYLTFVRCALLQAAKQDNIVYHGHAGQLFLEGIPHVLKVRVEAPLDMRVQALDMPHEQAVIHIANLDEQRRRWVKFLYDRDWHDPALYDLTVNLARMSLETATDIICEAVKHTEFQSTPDSRADLDNIALRCEVRACLIHDGHLDVDRLVITAAEGEVTIRGNVKNHDQMDLIKRSVEQISNVRSVEVYVDSLDEGIVGRAHPRELVHSVF
jgi:cytidylate kinase